MDEVMAAHLQEATIVEPLLADEDCLDCRLHVVIDAARAGATEEGEGLVVGIEDHLLALTHIGAGEHHPAVAEADMSNLHRRRHALDQNDLVAPVELVGLAGRVVERHVRFGRHSPSIFRPSLRIAPDRIVAAIVTQRPKLFVNPDQRQPFTRWFAFVRSQEALDLGLPPTRLR